MSSSPNKAVSETQLEQATQWFLRMRSEKARATDLSAFRRWLRSNPNHAAAYRQVAATWRIVGVHTSAPQMAVARRSALENARRAAASYVSRRAFPLRIALAATVLLALALGFSFLYLQRGDVYVTGIGESRALTLPDGSRVTMDAQSRIRVAYRERERFIVLEKGQARFAVAKDPARAFRVRADAQSIVALGTQFNVELLAGELLVAMIEGHVAVSGAVRTHEQINNRQIDNGEVNAREGVLPGSMPPNMPPGESAIELWTGQGLRVDRSGRATLIEHVDIDKVTGWQSGKLYFDDEPLYKVVERINRHSRPQISVDPAIAQIGISGVFKAGDSNAFVQAVSAYFKIDIERYDDSVRLVAKE